MLAARRNASLLPHACCIVPHTHHPDKPTLASAQGACLEPDGGLHSSRNGVAFHHQCRYGTIQFCLAHCSTPGALYFVSHFVSDRSVRMRTGACAAVMRDKARLDCLDCLDCCPSSAVQGPCPASVEAVK